MSPKDSLDYRLGKEQVSCKAKGMANLYNLELMNSFSPTKYYDKYPI